MKLLFCPVCGDIFNLQLHLKSCSCGMVKGLYIDYANAEVNGKGVSLAMGNGSLDMAIMNVSSVKEDFRNKPGSSSWDRHETTVICWVRPHEGPANPHTKINPEL